MIKKFMLDIGLLFVLYILLSSFVATVPYAVICMFHMNYYFQILLLYSYYTAIVPLYARRSDHNNEYQFDKPSECHFSLKY